LDLFLWHTIVMQKGQMWIIILLIKGYSIKKSWGRKSTKRVGWSEKPSPPKKRLGSEKIPKWVGVNPKRLEALENELGGRDWEEWDPSGENVGDLEGLKS